MQYTFLKAVKLKIFKKNDIFKIFAQKIEYRLWVQLEPPMKDGSKNGTHNHIYVPPTEGGGHIVFGAVPVGVDVGVSVGVGVRVGVRVRVASFLRDIF